MSEVTLTTKQRNKIARAVKALNDVKDEVQDENPDHFINWYLEDSNNLNLMSGESHNERGYQQQDKVIECFTLWNASGGGW